tara:strand:- start:142 stop:1164 length:1023 start_codon:yes stop_codon:yes gene_type:complete
MNINFLAFFVVFSLFLIFLCKKLNLFVDYKLEKHKRHSSKSKSYSIGGILLLIYLLYYFAYLKHEYLISIFLFLIFFIGLLSDIKKLNSVSIRFFLQIIFIFLFVNAIDIEIKTTKINFIDNLLSNSYINSLFVTFCLMILINGGNFIDGLNGLILKYYVVITFVILFYLNTFLLQDLEFFKNLTLILLVLLIFNIVGALYMGDSGAYLLSTLMGILLINFSSNNVSISPYLIILFFWYPCFELLFSMIRRKIKDNKTYKPDTQHLHQLLHDFIKSKFHIINEKFSHIITSFVINSYNLLVFIISIRFIYYSEILISILILNISIYLFTYFLLSKKMIKI